MSVSKSNDLISRSTALPASQPTIALALGGGGARGLAHVLMLEAFDELGIKPVAIAGTSIGAIFGAAYASGLSGREIRTHMLEVLTVRFDLVRDLFNARARNVTPRLWNLFQAPAAILSSETLLEVIFPEKVARDFADVEIPLSIVASDFYGMEPFVFRNGPLRRAVAASMALPVIFEPILQDDTVLIDGGLTNPLPFDLLQGKAEIVVAIDVSGVPVPQADRAHPSASEALLGASFLFERTIVREKLKHGQPDIYIDAGTSRFQVLDFLKAAEILAAAEPAKAKLKAQLERVLTSETLPVIEDGRADSGRTEALPDRTSLLRIGPGSQSGVSGTSGRKPPGSAS